MPSAQPSGLLRVPPADPSGTRAGVKSTSAGRMFKLNNGETPGMQQTLDPTKDPIDLLPLRPWEVKKVRGRLAEMQGDPPAPTREARTVIANVIEAHRAALAEYEATPWHARFRRRSKRRLKAIRSHRSRIVGRPQTTTR